MLLPFATSRFKTTVMCSNQKQKSTIVQKTNPKSNKNTVMEIKRQTLTILAVIQNSAYSPVLMTLLDNTESINYNTWIAML